MRGARVLASALFAALVAGCAAPTTYPPLANIMECHHEGYCQTEAKGFITKSALGVPGYEVPPATEKFNFHIPNKCKEWGRELAGSVVHACDADAAPTLTLLSDAGVGSAQLRRNGALLTPANIFLKQYCI